MSSARIALGTLLAPSEALAEAAVRRSVAPPLLAATALSVLLAAALAPRLDYAASAEASADAAPEAASSLETPHDREAKLEHAARVGTFLVYAAAIVGPALRAVAVAGALAFGFWLSGTPAAFTRTLPVVSYGLLPLALRDLLSLPAALASQGLRPEDAEHLVPSSLAAFLPPATARPLLGLAGGLDLFALWSLVLVALGMARVAGASPRRALAVVLGLWVSYLVCVRVALPGLVARAA